MLLSSLRTSFSGEMEDGMEIGGYFATQRKMLKLGSISLNDNESFIYKIYCLIVRIAFVIYLLALLSDVVIEMHDLDVVINSLYHAMAVCVVLSKIWVITFNYKKLDQTLKMLESGVFAPNRQRGGPVEEIWIKDSVTISRRVTILGLALALITLYIPIVASMVKRLINEDVQRWELPFGKCTIFKPDRGLNFDLAWLFQSIVFNLAAVIYLATDFLVVVVFAHICVQFKMLRNSISRNISWTFPKSVLGGDDDKERRSKENWPYLASKLKDNVMYHTAIIDLASQFEDILNVVMLNTYLAEMFALGCIMYHGSLYSAWDPRFQKDAMMLVALSFQVFLVSYWGNEIMLESQTIHDACYDVDFVNMDGRLQKGLCLMMMRSLRPVRFTAGKFADLSLVTFVALMRASFSYYMVLRSRNLEK